MADFSFYWHDYETFGTDPARDRPSQFAGIRTDADFNIIGEPLVIFCKPADDMLPHPEACLVTGITPQQALEQGLPEVEFIRQIHAEFVQPGTCAVGYNSIRFDDEFSRYTLYRNFYDAYAREWQNGNSRWDIIDMVRLCCALRPEGIVWPTHEDGTTSFRLEQITEANGISHEAAHDALSDVHATIAVAKLIKDKQPRLFDYVFKLRNKRDVAALLNVAEKKPVLHTSAMFPASRFCSSLVMPLAMHPTNKNGVICYDLAVDPTPLIELNAEQIADRLYTPAAELPEGLARIPLKTIHTNRCPVVATTSLLTDTVAERIQLDLPQTRQHYKLLMQAGSLTEKLAEVFSSQNFPEQKDPDTMLYGGGFFGQNDKSVMAQVRSSTPEELRDNTFYFEDTRLTEMLFRYRARNYPESLTEEERLQWQEYRYQRLTEADGGGSLVLEDFLENVQNRLEAEAISPRDQQILEQLLDYSDQLLA
ncbi:exodeoxyribonuclease I [Oceanicoccus sagamiensis]|uniref:Exodeoxyribonuclease I n=1 Tax=Oceanicoccus sagamiensis TaxID=716816 RepID=A0A1X9N3S5_9GAMM|nr:exodeoxyribonuclease I [Oceanicoccus sagamiensis]ARN72838.1 exodeoxyribonuclease I [Oceanicoccus sagamiensis]